MLNLKKRNSTVVYLNQIFLEQNSSDDTSLEEKCGGLMCMIYCENGYLLDSNGCQMCACKTKKCESVVCRIFCEKGFQLDSEGCEICACN